VTNAWAKRLAFQKYEAPYEPPWHETPANKLRLKLFLPARIAEAALQRRTRRHDKLAELGSRSYNPLGRSRPRGNQESFTHMNPKSRRSNLPQFTPPAREKGADFHPPGCSAKDRRTGSRIRNLRCRFAPSPGGTMLTFRVPPQTERDHPHGHGARPTDKVTRSRNLSQENKADTGIRTQDHSNKTPAEVPIKTHDCRCLTMLSVSLSSRSTCLTMLYVALSHTLSAGRCSM